MLFHFKHFAVSHAYSSMKVGTDAVLLGAWSDSSDATTILDIGTGCGLIAIMMAQKNNSATITAIDIEENSIVEAKQNFNNTIWNHRLSAQQISIQDFALSTTQKFDFIICNPPFFSRSTHSPNKIRHQARHTDTLPPLDFFKSCLALMADHGKISLILPFDSSSNWINAAETFGLYPSKMTNVFSYPTKPIERLIVEFTKINLPPATTDFYIRQGKNLPYSEAYIQLTNAFYL